MSDTMCDSGLQSLTIKPSAVCSNACPYCAGRKRLLAAHGERGSLAVNDWRNVISDAAKRGAQRVDISGGEPTLYPQLRQLVAVCKTLMFTSINSNGFALDGALIRDLTAMDLDNISISLISLDEQTHNQVRRSPDGHRRAVAAIKSCCEAGIHTTLHFILSRFNYRTLPELFTFMHDVGVRALVLAYPENDNQAHNLLMDRQQIHEFRSHVVPAASDIFRERFGYDIRSKLTKLFNEPDMCDFSEGIYNSTADVCTIPRCFVLVYPDGSVLPCNGVEYSHKPLMGNVSRTSLADIWLGKDYVGFRSGTHGFCTRCPLPHMFYHKI